MLRSCFGAICPSALGVLQIEQQYISLAPGGLAQHRRVNMDSLLVFLTAGAFALIGRVPPKNRCSRVCRWGKCSAYAPVLIYVHPRLCSPHSGKGSGSPKPGACRLPKWHDAHFHTKLLLSSDQSSQRAGCSYLRQWQCLPKCDVLVRGEDLVCQNPQ